MRVSEYRDLISAVSDKFASARSAATDQEMDNECRALIRLVQELEAAGCPTARAKDREKAARVAELARQHVNSSLMYLYDNQYGPMVDHV